MSGFYTEADYENSIIELFQNMGYRYVYAPDLERDFRSPLYEEELQIANSWVDGKTVYIELQGEQTSYKEAALQGAEINFKVNLTF